MLQALKISIHIPGVQGGNVLGVKDTQSHHFLLKAKNLKNLNTLQFMSTYFFKCFEPSVVNFRVVLVSSNTTVSVTMASFIIKSLSLWVFYLPVFIRKTIKVIPKVVRSNVNIAIRTRAIESALFIFESSFLNSKTNHTMQFLLISPLHYAPVILKTWS